MKKSITKFIVTLVFADADCLPTIENYVCNTKDEAISKVDDFREKAKERYDYEYNVLDNFGSYFEIVNESGNSYTVCSMEELTLEV